MRHDTTGNAKTHTWTYHGVWVSCDTFYTYKLDLLECFTCTSTLPQTHGSRINSSHSSSDILSFYIALRSRASLSCDGIFSKYFAHFYYCWEPFRGILRTYYFIWLKCGLENQISPHDVITNVLVLYFLNLPRQQETFRHLELRPESISGIRRMTSLLR